VTNRSDFFNFSAADIVKKNKRELQTGINSIGTVTNKNYNQLMGYAKKGGIINSAQLRKIVEKVKSPEPVYKVVEIVEEDIPKFENGGTLQNIIPDGALHARKHNLPSDISEYVTDKGIPVVTIAEAGEKLTDDDGKEILAKGGEITQHAEIERDEIIFTKEVTDILEGYYKKYNELKEEEDRNVLLIEIGKYLASQILENTIDNTGLIEKVT
jgi:hypothetical protein